ncbi:hypothetical protein [Shinella sp.]|uniref:hypothetical protein n=1 Tax=Shinella sp. TaxID=1870904 RepID=UPI0039E651BF
MDVIRWQYAVNQASAWVGDIMVAEIDIEIVCGRIHVSWEPEGIRFCDGCQIDSVRRYVGSEDEAKKQVEAYVDEWLASAGLMPKPKQRTEADFRNADIDANGYVTFRDGGVA